VSEQNALSRPALAPVRLMRISESCMAYSLRHVLALDVSHNVLAVITARK